MRVLSNVKKLSKKVAAQEQRQVALKIELAEVKLANNALKDICNTYQDYLLGLEQEKDNIQTYSLALKNQVAGLEEELNKLKRQET